MSGLIRSANDRVKIIPVTEQDEFLKMEKEWNSLLQNSQSNTIFLTWEWLSAWWKSYTNGKQLYILRVEKNGRLIGLVPFYRKTIKKYGVISFSILTLIGDGSNDSEYLDWISQNGEEELVVRSVMDYCLDNREIWDLIQLYEIPEQSPHMSLLRNVFSQKGWYYNDEEVPCAYVNFSSNWDMYLKSLKPRMRTKVRSLTKRLEQKFEVRFDQCRQVNDLESWLESFFDIHNKRWKINKRDGAFISASKRRFYMEMSHLFLLRGWLRFYTLKRRWSLRGISVLL